MQEQKELSLALVCNFGVTKTPYKTHKQKESPQASSNQNKAHNTLRDE